MDSSILASGIDDRDSSLKMQQFQIRPTYRLIMPLNHPQMNCGLWGQVPSGLLNPSPEGTFRLARNLFAGGPQA
jgi:hypothetical protein